MDYLRQQRHPLQSLPGIGAVVLLHVGLIYALMNGLGTNVARHEPPPMTARIVDVVIPPPPPPPLRPVMTQPKMFVPQVDIKVAPPPATPQTPVDTSSTPSPSSTAPRVNPGAAPEQVFTPSQILAGDKAPAYPEAYADATRPGAVTVDCVIETDGNPTQCRVISTRGGQAFAAETLRWLRGPSHPIYRPSVLNGRKQREEHQWVVTFQPAQ